MELITLMAIVAIIVMAAMNVMALKEIFKLEDENEILKRTIADLMKEKPGERIDTAELIREADEREMY